MLGTRAYFLAMLSIMAYETDRGFHEVKPRGVSSVAVAKPFMRKRGNPYWGQPQTVATPTLVTGFEAQMRRLGLTTEMCAGSAELRIWVRAQQKPLLHTRVAS